MNRCNDFHKLALIQKQNTIHGIPEFSIVVNLKIWF